MPTESNPIDTCVVNALARYQHGSWRAPLFCELVLNDVRMLGGKAHVLDIGCGTGFDGSERLQREIENECRYFCGVEPDATIARQDHFSEVHSCNFEDAPLTQSSFDVAYAVFVLEHLTHPDIFWSKLVSILKPGGVFWGFTMDRRHYFSWLSTLLQWMRIKDAYLRTVQGDDHYENYPTRYQCNTPHALTIYGRAFSQVRWWNWNRQGQMDAYVPQKLRFASHVVDRLEMALNLPGSLLLVRAIR